MVGASWAVANAIEMTEAKIRPPRPNRMVTWGGVKRVPMSRPKSTCHETSQYRPMAATRRKSRPVRIPAIAHPAMPVRRSRESLIESKKYRRGFFCSLWPKAFRSSEHTM